MLVFFLQPGNARELVSSVWWLESTVYTLCILFFCDIRFGQRFNEGVLPWSQNCLSPWIVFTRDTRV